MIQKGYRLPDELLAQILDDQKQRGISSENEYITQALEHFLKCKQTEQNQAMKLIVLKFAGACLKCGQKLEAGTWALWGRGVGLVCLDCYVKRMGDKTLVAKYLKNRELSKITKSLQDEADKLADKVEVLQAADKSVKLIDNQEKLLELVKKYLTEKVGTAEEKTALEEIMRQSAIVQGCIKDSEDYISQHYLKQKKWIRKRTKPESED